MLAIAVLSVAIAGSGCQRTSGPATSKDQPVTQNENHVASTGTPNGSAALQDASDIVATDLPVRTPREAGAPLFARMAVEQTKLDFAHQWQPPAGYQLQVYQSLPGGGVCLGDYDNDGLVDVYLTQPFVGCRLYRNLGQWRFRDVTQQAGLGENPHGMGCSFVDVNGDGQLDLYVCNYDAPNQLYLNQGDGTFRESARQAGLAFHGASVMMAFADYDRDGDLDAYLVTNRLDPTGSTAGLAKLVNGRPYVPAEHRERVDVITPADGKPRVVKAGQYDHFYRNNGDGTFTDVTQDAGMDGNYWGLNAIWWDYDGDSWPDLYVSNDFYGPDQLYRNNGDGTFSLTTKQAMPHTPWYSMGTDVADINNDGWLDLMGSDMSGTDHYKQKVSMGDMNTNGWFLTHPTPRQYMRNALYLNTGGRRFMEIAYLAGVANTDWTWSLKFADADEDGWVDLYVTNGMNRDWVNTDLRSQANAQPTAEQRMQVWMKAEQRKDANLAFRNTGDLKLQSAADAWGLNEEVVSYGAAWGDLDNDGDLDLIVNNAQQAPGVYRNQSHDTHRVTLRLQGRNNRWGVGARVSLTTAAGQQTRQLTNSQGYMSSNSPRLHFGLGEQTQIQQLTVVWPDGQRQTWRDLPADRHYRLVQTEPAEGKSSSVDETDVVTADASPLLRRTDLLSDVQHREQYYDDYQRQPLLPQQQSQLGPGHAWADIDADGDLDLYVAGAAGQAGQLRLNRGDGTFATTVGPWQDETQREELGVLFFDADGDGDQDLYVVAGGVECEPDDDVLRDRLFLNQYVEDGKDAAAGVSSEQEPPRFIDGSDRLPSLADSGGCVVAADFDRDGDLDLLVGGRVIPGQYPLSPNTRLLRNDGGRFVDATDEVAEGLREAGMVSAALWTDVDNDGWLDLMLACEWGPVRLFHNESGQRLIERTAQAGLSARIGWYNSLAARDVDGDGDLDYVVTNVGLNTKYHANDAHPTRLYCGDFDDSGHLRLIEAEYEHDTLFPVRGKSCSTNAMPFLADKFTKFHDFAVADLQQIYTPEKLAGAHQFSANTLESGVLINDGQGQFRFQPLPRWAQAAPSFGILLTELNGDGHADLCLAQNFYGPQRETGRMDGGVGAVLLGRGDGSFEVLPMPSSGLLVQGDATSMTMANLRPDGTRQIVVARNDATMLSFELPANSELLMVHLSGLAAGARVTATSEDGRTQTAELSRGGGYLSQSPPELLFGRRSTIRQLEVRWPDGQRTRVDDPLRFQTGNIELTAPAGEAGEESNSTPVAATGTAQGVSR